MCDVIEAFDQFVAYSLYRLLQALIDPVVSNLHLDCVKFELNARGYRVIVLPKGLHIPDERVEELDRCRGLLKAAVEVGLEVYQTVDAALEDLRIAEIGNVLVHGLKGGGVQTAPLKRDAS